MIKYKLKCKRCKKSFDSWFSSSKEYEKLKKINLIEFIEQYLQPLNNSLTNINFLFEKNKNKKIFLMADEKQLRQVFTNIFKNSYENFVENKVINPNLRIILNKENGKIKILINDNGTGINKTVKNNILEPYYTTKKNGTGLGLSISKKIMEDHLGNIYIKSKKDKGTLVTLVFPIVN